MKDNAEAPPAPRPLVIDPALFKPEAVSPQTLALHEGLRQRMAAGGLADLGVERARALMVVKQPPSPRAEERTIPGPAGGPLKMRIIAPDRPRGAFLHFHGGAFMLGAADAQDSMLDRVANASGLACVSVEYRLAPEHPYPAAWDDAETAAVWLARHASEFFGGDVLAIGGESAGATLAASTLLRLRDRHGFTGFAAAVLSYGKYDSSGTPSHRWNGRKGLMIRDVDTAFATNLYAPDPARRRDPDMSALYADLRDMPPTLFTVGTEDPFLDDSLFLAARWIAAGRSAELAIYPAGTHGLTALPGPLAEQANARIDAFLTAAPSFV